MTINRWRGTALLIGMLALGLCSTATARTPVGPMPIGNPGEWATTDDYPARALRYEEQGVVGFRLVVDAEGVPASCKVMQTSKSDALDTQTCNLLMQRARFIPATNSAGKPTEGLYYNSIRWTIPEGEPTLIGPAEMIVHFVIGTDGEAHDCKIEKATGTFPFPTDGPDGPCGPGEKYALTIGKDGKPVARRVTMHLSIEVEDLPPAQAPAQ